LRSSAFVLQNKSGRAIIGVAINFVLTDEAGATTTRMLQSHSFIDPSFKPISSVGEAVLIVPPLTLVKEFVMQRRGGRIFQPAPARMINMVATAKEIHAQIDVLIFGDGEILGDNHSQLQADIAGRKAAADIIVRQVNASDSLTLNPPNASPSSKVVTQIPAQFPSQKINDVLEGIYGRLPADHPIWQALDGLKKLPRSGLTGKHIRGWLSQLQTTAFFKGIFNYIKSIPEPPVFYRKDGKPL
jgi:hypothetical protein